MEWHFKIAPDNERQQLSIHREFCQFRPTYHPVITSGIRKSNIGITHQTCLELIDVKSAFDVVHTHI
jgi:hypothetical protein